MEKAFQYLFNGKKEEKVKYFKDESSEISKTDENEIFQKDIYHDDSVRIFHTIEEPYFIAQDIAEFFEVKDNIRRYCKEILREQEKMAKSKTITKKLKTYVGKIIRTNKQNMKVAIWYFTEDGLYRYITSIKSLKAKDFAEHMTAIMIKLRKKGEVKIAEKDAVDNDLLNKKIKGFNQYFEFFQDDEEPEAMIACIGIKHIFDIEKKSNTIDYTVPLKKSQEVHEFLVNIKDIIMAKFPVFVQYAKSITNYLGDYYFTKNKLGEYDNTTNEVVYMPDYEVEYETITPDDDKLYKKGDDVNTLNNQKQFRNYLRNKIMYHINWIQVITNDIIDMKL